MRVLYLGPPNVLASFLSDCGHSVRRVEEELGPDGFGDAEFVVSYGYRHVIRDAEELARMDGRAVNLHIGYLPWGRGADPNLWAHLGLEPSGVTIHLLAPGLDKGDVLGRRLVQMRPEDTLATSYARLKSEIEAMFIELWPEMAAGRLERVPQEPGGSYHRVADRSKVEHLLTRGWDTPIADLRNAAFAVLAEYSQ